MRIGQGYDVHRLEPGRPLVLAGVKISHDRGPLAHSDGDVLLHAICDALLGAAGLGDIGLCFPDSDQAYRGISSRLLLQRVAEMLRVEGFELVNLDATVIAEAPKLSPYRSEMEANIAADLKTGPGQINIKATTTEGLGFTGDNSGIAAQAICLIQRAGFDPTSLASPL
ncbi:MAG: 2-C-methyl-D-erythritol 2,4-cyclodiphosphate synthase [Gammaproteobacteria bacterium]|nr:2-C-methyl-D-erythritol 2,4-cyclodiphosphate synthase [Gammaproteobacteria bacterium]